LQLTLIDVAVFHVIAGGCVSVMLVVFVQLFPSLIVIVYVFADRFVNVPVALVVFVGCKL
jgi:hypothetical protein